MTMYDDREIMGQCPCCESDLGGIDYEQGYCPDCLEAIDSIEPDEQEDTCLNL